MNEFQLMRGFRNGLAKNFSFAFKELYPSLCFFALKITNNQMVAEDIAQESFVKIWQKRVQFSNLSSLKSYLYTIVKNNAINWAKKNCREIKAKQELSRVAIGAEQYIFESLVQAEVFRELTTSIEKLSPQTQKILKMIYFEGLKVKDVANILGISISTVKTLQYRALSKLKGNIGFIILYFLHN